MNRRVKIINWSKDSFLKMLYPRTLLFDMLMFYILIKLKVTLLKYDIVIFDRFFIDTIVDVMYEAGNLKVINSLLARLALTLTKSASACVMLDVDPNIAWQRKKDIISTTELRYKRVIYHYLAKKFNITVINTSNFSLCEVVSLVMKKIR